MVKIEQQEDGTLIDGVIYFGDSDSNASLILHTVKGEAVTYESGESESRIIDFPGEYEISGFNIRCWEAEKKLSYVVKIKGKKLALLSNSAVLDIGTFDGVDQFWCVDDKTISEIDKLELPGDVYLFGETEIKNSGPKKPISKDDDDEYESEDEYSDDEE